MSSGTATDVREGDMLAGKYRISKVLGVGGMGVVVAAHHVELDKKVAIKFLLDEMLSSGEAVARFAREARAAVKIQSEHVARVSDVGKLESGAPYMVMEYLEGSDLARWLEERGKLPVDQVLELVLQACEAIAEAHTLGIVHRDLKPANLFVIRRPDGAYSVKVLDFGISKMGGPGGAGFDAAMTKTSALMGSPLYMSPEQLESSRSVDWRGDIWALGVILFELIAGFAPFRGETMTELILQIMTREPPSLKAARPDLVDGLEAVILKCLAKDRNARFQTVGELAVALAPFASKRARGSVERISGVLNAGATPAEAFSQTSSDGEWTSKPQSATAAQWARTTTGKSGATKRVVAGVVALVVLGASLLALTSRKPATGAAAPASQSAVTLAVPSTVAAASPPLATEAPPAAAEPPPAAPADASAAPSPSASANPAASTSEPGPGMLSKPAQPPAAIRPINPKKNAKPTDEWGDGRL